MEFYLIHLFSCSLLKKTIAKLAAIQNFQVECVQSFDFRSSQKIYYCESQSKSHKTENTMAELENINPNIYKKTDIREVSKDELNEDVADPIDAREVFGEICLWFLSMQILIVIISSQIWSEASTILSIR